MNEYFVYKQKSMNQSNQSDYDGSKIDTPQLGTVVNSCYPIFLSFYHLFSINYSSILKWLLLLSSPLFILSLKNISKSLYLLFSATIRPNFSLEIIQLYINNDFTLIFKADLHYYTSSTTSYVWKRQYYEFNVHNPLTNCSNVMFLLLC